MENVPTFIYLGRPIDQTDDGFPDVRRNIMHARLVWGRLGTLIRREGEYPKVSASFYRAVVQDILLFGLEMWILLASIKKMIEGTHTEFLRMITGKITKKLEDETWETTGSEGTREAAGTKLDMIYIERRQATVVQWVLLHPLFGVCTRETEYE